MCGTPRWSRNENEVGVVRVNGAFDAVTDRQECVETLYEIGVSAEEGRNSVNDAGSVDADVHEQRCVN